MRDNVTVTITMREFDFPTVTLRLEGGTLRTGRAVGMLLGRGMVPRRKQTLFVALLNEPTAQRPLATRTLMALEVTATTEPTRDAFEGEGRLLDVFATPEEVARLMEP